MFSVLKKISDFAGTRRGLLKKSMAVAFLGAVFAALQFAALMLTLDILVGGADLRIWPVIGVMVVSVVGRAACSYWSTNAETETGYQPPQLLHPHAVSLSPCAQPHRCGGQRQVPGSD